ncbi:hypothetical protein SERLA73DRAFT_150202 [Serpula lacrymans var. lacrymans S7.3]|uniref:Uncharacterized protein n=1 Tax=Serpula lacrymans var. lacrymans (strain S7.3) TaxID=936435 RepID=F8PLH2_SERL3|nr:hypothetical protein SERLA73DRAFT_150202 [Serpula lacrymans var. lacrymans S7.3]
MQKYQRALDHLEGLVLPHMFELKKMNWSQTGYTLCKHIGKALQAQLATIQTALDHYNPSAMLWATPAGHLVMDKHFKICHAHEEIRCLNFEIRQFVMCLRGVGCSVDGEMAQAADTQEHLKDKEQDEEDNIKISATFECIVHISGNT